MVVVVATAMVEMRSLMFCTSLGKWSNVFSKKCVAMISLVVSVMLAMEDRRVQQTPLRQDAASLSLLSEVLDDMTISGRARTYTLFVLALAHPSLPLDHGQNISLISIKFLGVAPTVAGRERLAEENTTSRGKFEIHAPCQKIFVSGNNEYNI